MNAIARRRLWSFFEALYSQELTAGSPRINTPAWIKQSLLPHQQAALAAALQLERSKHEGMDVGNIAGDSIGGKLYTSHGIFADPVGSGKSLSVLALLKYPPPSTYYTEYVTRSGSGFADGRDVGLLRNRNQLITSYGANLRPVRAALLLVPHALMGQWEQYITRDTTLKARYIRRKQDAADETFLQSIETYDVVVVSSTMWPIFRTSQPVSSLLWSRVFIDEADSITLSNANEEIHGLFYWFISASWMNLVFVGGAYFNIEVTYRPPPETPPEIVRRVQQLQGSSNMLCIPGCRHMNIVRRMCGLGNGGYLTINSAGSQSARLIIHSNAEFLESSFARPIIRHSTILCETPANIFVLDSFISPAMMERLHAGDIHGALDMVGMHTASESDVISAVTVSLEKELENAKRTYEYKKSMEYSTEQVKQKAIETCEQKIAALENRIQAIKDRIKTSAEQTCPICYCNVTSTPAVTPCCHQVFCFPCLCESLKRVSACPMCRTRISDLKEIKVVGETGTDPKESLPIMKKKHKKAACIEFIKANPRAKILMFSGYDGTFSGLESELRAESISFAALSGSQARIAKLLTDFQNGKYNILFLNARNMGAGLNIDAASHVLLFHRMSAELESQIIGRALRLGRKDPLDVIHLLHDNEIRAQNILTHE
jgi:SNF2 family DNA or RNA helicase